MSLLDYRIPRLEYGPQEIESKLQDKILIWSVILPLRVKLKRIHFFRKSFRFFQICFRCFFPVSFRKKAGTTPENNGDFSGKKRNLLGFGVCAKKRNFTRNFCIFYLLLAGSCRDLGGGELKRSNSRCSSNIRMSVEYSIQTSVRQATQINSHSQAGLSPSLIETVISAQILIVDNRKGKQCHLLYERQFFKYHV